MPDSIAGIQNPQQQQLMPAVQQPRYTRETSDGMGIRQLDQYSIDDLYNILSTGEALEYGQGNQFYDRKNNSTFAMPIFAGSSAIEQGLSFGPEGAMYRGTPIAESTLRSELEQLYGKDGYSQLLYTTPNGESNRQIVAGSNGQELMNRDFSSASSGISKVAKPLVFATLAAMSGGAASAAAGGGAMGAAAGGAASGATSAGLTGGDVLEGALFGALTGGLGNGVGAAASNAVGGGALGNIAGGAVRGGLGAAVRGGDVLQGLLGGSLTSGVSQLNPAGMLGIDNAGAANSVNGALARMLLGGDPRQAALSGGLGALGSYGRSALSSSLVPGQENFEFTDWETDPLNTRSSEMPDDFYGDAGDYDMPTNQLQPGWWSGLGDSGYMPPSTFNPAQDSQAYNDLFGVTSPTVSQGDLTNMPQFDFGSLLGGGNQNGNGLGGLLGSLGSSAGGYLSRLFDGDPRALNQARMALGALGMLSSVTSDRTPRNVLTPQQLQGMLGSGANAAMDFSPTQKAASEKFFTSPLASLAPPSASDAMTRYGIDPFASKRAMATGGPVTGAGRFVSSGAYAGGGQADNVDALLSPGEYVIDADVVSALGDGSNDAGARRLDEMREAIRRHKRSAPASAIPPLARSPLAYLKGN